MKTDKKRKLLTSALLCLVMLAAALLIRQPYWRSVFINACIFSSLAMLYNLTYGFVGVYNFGFAAFFGIGAYTSAILATDFGIPVVFAMIISMLFSGLCGFILMIPCLRMHGFTPGIVTLAFGEIVRILIMSSSNLTNGEMGYWGIVPLFESEQAYAVAAALMLSVIAVLIALLIKSKVGLAFNTIHDDQLAAQSIGNNVNAYKLLAMALSTAGAGVVGAFYAHYLLTITPNICGLGYTTQILCMALFGGGGTILGPAVGGMTLTVLTEALRFLESYRMLIYGLLLIFTVFFFPKGLAGIAHSIRNLVPHRRKEVSKDA